MIDSRYDRQILSLGDADLERFVRDWVESKGRSASYCEYTRFGGPGDKGRDVVGFLSAARHEGSWHNYQCKQYNRALPTANGIREIGKILYYSCCGHFTAPDKYFFVTPKGVNKNLEDLIYKPRAFQETILDGWDKYCGNRISTNENIALSKELKEFIEAYDFSKISRLDLDDILNDQDVRPVLAKWFGADPGPPPRGVVPDEIQDSELTYIMQLLDAYGDRMGVAYSSYHEISEHPEYEHHLIRQRERFHDAEAFKRFYRDNTESEVVHAFEEDVYHGVIETCNASHLDRLACVDSVMKQAANTIVSGTLARHARTPVKQGVCHHFANENRLRWRRW